MRLTASEKYEIIRQITRSELGVKRTLQEYGIARSTFYKWYQNYLENGLKGLNPKQRISSRQWNSIPEAQKNLVVEEAILKVMSLGKDTDTNGAITGVLAGILMDMRVLSIPLHWIGSLK